MNPFYLLSLSLILPIILVIHSKRRRKREKQRPISSGEKFLLFLFFVLAFISYFLVAWFWAFLIEEIEYATYLQDPGLGGLGFSLAIIYLNLPISLVSSTAFASSIINYLLTKEGWYETILPILLFVLFIILPSIFYFGIYNDNLILFLRYINLI